MDALNSKITIEFYNLEEMKRVQVDMCRIMQKAAFTELKDGNGSTDGYNMLCMLEQMCEKAFDVAADEINELKNIKNVA